MITLIPTMSRSESLDSGGLTADQAITVTVTDANDAPTFTTTTTIYQVAENQTSVTVIAGNDEDVGQSVSFSITGGVDMALQIDATTGALTFQAAPNYESPSSVSGTNDYLVEINLTDDNAPTPATSLSILALTVQVTDVNDSPTITTAAAASCQ